MLTNKLVSLPLDRHQFTMTIANLCLSMAPIKPKSGYIGDSKICLCQMIGDELAAQVIKEGSRVGGMMMAAPLCNNQFAVYTAHSINGDVEYHQIFIGNCLPGSPPGNSLRSLPKPQKHQTYTPPHRWERGI